MCSTDEEYISAFIGYYYYLTFQSVILGRYNPCTNNGYNMPQCSHIKRFLIYRWVFIHIYQVNQYIMHVYT